MNLPEFPSFIFSLLFLYLGVCFWSYVIHGPSWARTGINPAQSQGRVKECGGPFRTITVNQSGQAQFRTIQSAIDTISTKTWNTQWIRIQISPGIYREQVGITKRQSCIYLEGGGSNSTIIEWDGHKSRTSPTFISRADNTVAKGITFKNTYNYRGGANPIAPAEAATVRGNKCSFHECAFLGVQDTLFDHSGRHYFYRCFIQGGIDFIFGGGRSIYEECTINFSMGKSAPGRGGVITANSRESNEDLSGFVFKNCIITGKGKGLAYLGRGYRNHSTVIIANSYLGDVIAPIGWDAWTGANHVENLIYAEEGCWGPGADKSKRPPWMKQLSGSELDQYVNMSFIDQEGWIHKHPIYSS